MESSEALDTVRERLRNDIRTTLKRNGLDVADDIWVEILVTELAEDGMFYIEKVIADE